MHDLKFCLVADTKVAECRKKKQTRVIEELHDQPKKDFNWRLLLSYLKRDWFFLLVAVTVSCSELQHRDSNHDDASASAGASANAQLTQLNSAQLISPQAAGH